MEKRYQHLSLAERIELYRLHRAGSSMRAIALALGRSISWSPEQIAGRLRTDAGHTLVSHEAIYRFVYRRSAQKDYWHRLLPRRKSRRGRLGRRGGSPVEHILDRVPIQERAAEISRPSLARLAS
jgi:IS30 family transposase